MSRGGPFSPATRSRGRGRAGRGPVAGWLLAHASGVSLLLSLTVHGGLLTASAVLVASACNSEPAKILLPKGTTAVEVRMVKAETRTVQPPKPEVRQATAVAMVPMPEPVAPQPEKRPPDPPPPPPPDEPEPVVEPVFVATAAICEPIEPKPAPVSPPPPEPLPVERPGPPKPKPVVVPPPSTPQSEHPHVAETAPRPDEVPEPAEPPDQRGPPGTRGVDSGVRIADMPAPRYPPSCRRRGEQGLVRLEVEVLADGQVGRITVLRHADSPKLDDAAIDAVRQARFVPAMRDGTPVASTVVIPVRFQIR